MREFKPLPAETTTQPDAVEKYVCEAIKKLKQHQMDEETGKLLIQMMVGGEMPLDAIPEKEKPQLYRIIESRTRACFTMEIKDPRVIIFLMQLSRNPGNAVMYLAYFQWYLFKLNKRVLTLEDICEAFPMGFPSDEDLLKVWDSQKVLKGGDKNDTALGFQSDNLVDYGAAYNSIQFTKEKKSFEEYREATPNEKSKPE